MVIQGGSVIMGTTYLAIKNPEKWDELEKQFIQDINEIFEQWEKERVKSIRDNQDEELFEF